MVKKGGGIRHSRSMPSWDSAAAGEEPSWGSAFPGGRSRLFPLDNHPAREQPSGECRRNGLRKSKRGQSEATLNNQERGKDWEYRVIAANKAREGVPSNTAAAAV